jgi:hypothetical protein
MNFLVELEREVEGIEGKSTGIEQIELKAPLSAGSRTYFLPVYNQFLVRVVSISFEDVRSGTILIQGYIRAYTGPYRAGSLNYPRVSLVY